MDGGVALICRKRKERELDRMMMLMPASFLVLGAGSLALSLFGLWALGFGIIRSDPVFCSLDDLSFELNSILGGGAQLRQRRQSCLYCT
jgi:hypothetical protein